MKKTLLFALGTIVFLSTYPAHHKTQIAFAGIKETSFTKVHFTDRFWLPRMEINRTVSIPSAFRQCEINGRFDNFALAGKLMEGEHKGDFSFDDTDPYKIIEGASYSLALKYDEKLDAYLDSVIGLIAAAQEPDGYLTTCVTNKCERLSGWWGKSRWEKVNSHELYNCGHLYEAAVAHYKATGKRTLLNVALKNADLICEVFGLGEGQIKYPSGHPIIEMALVKLYHVTNDEKYLRQARYFVDEAGRLSNGRKPSPYSQDHMPILKQQEIVGHAVRAAYLFSGVTDVASLQNDTELFAAVERIWENMTARKLYLNGGIGSRPQGEGFGPDYELNNFSNYCETCASIANIYWNHRMFLASGQSKYYDVLERTLYNGVIAGISLSGDKFFYDNPQATLGGHHREPWFGCACCPGNVTRFMASIPGYVYATHKNDVYVNLFVESDAHLELEKGAVNLKQVTNYPWDGNIDIIINPKESNHFTLFVRIPGWAKNKPVPSDLYRYVDEKESTITLSVNGKKQNVRLQNGYAVIERKWKANDKVSLHLEMPVHRVQAHHKAWYDEGLLALERGPVLYALEAIDNKDYLLDIVIPRDSEIEARYEAGLLNGVVTLKGNAFVVEKNAANGSLKEKEFTFKAVPYSTWNNRNIGAMLVFIPDKADYAIVKPEPTLASRAKMVGGWGYNDQMEPKSSADTNTPYQYWWLKAGTEESVGYRFDQPEKVSSVEVYWLAFEHYDVIYKAPESWKLLYKEGDEWKEVKNPSGYGTKIDTYNKVTFDPVFTTELKIVAQLQRPPAGNVSSNEVGPQIMDAARKGYSGGIIEWKVY